MSGLLLYDGQRLSGVINGCRKLVAAVEAAANVDRFYGYSNTEVVRGIGQQVDLYLSRIRHREVTNQFNCPGIRGYGDLRAIAYMDDNDRS